jgi:LacI family transcriptional regulator
VPTVTLGAMPARGKRPTLRDIAAETGLSPAAVSYALRGLQVPEATQERVRAAAEKLGYQVDPIARALASGRTGYVGVLCGSQEDSWQQTVLAALGRGLLGAGLHALMVDALNDPELEATLARRLVDQRVDALIVLPVDPQGGYWTEIADVTVLISIGDSLPGAGAAAEVVFDNAAGVTDALQRIATAGHTRVAVLSPIAASTPDRPAEQVVHRVAPALGLTADVRMCPHDLDGATAVARELLSGPERPSAVLCLADAFAYGVYAAADELDLLIPEQVSVLGFDDRPVSRLLRPPLSSYRWPVDALVEAVVEHTLQAVDEGGTGRRTVLAGRPRMRGSLGPAPRS